MGNRRMSKRFVVNIKPRLFRPPLVIVEVESTYPQGINSALAGQKFRYPADVYDIPEITNRLWKNEDL